jgi:transcriptional regulator GlxA family with amidase domain
LNGLGIIENISVVARTTEVSQEQMEGGLDPQAQALVPPTPPPGVAPDLRVGFLLSPRFTILPFAGFIDCLRHAADEADYSRQIHCAWRVVAPSLASIEASCGLSVMPQAVFPDPGEFDYLVVIGGLLPWCLEQPAETYDYLRAAYADGVQVAGLCTGSFVLAKAGLLEGRLCAVHFEHRQQLIELFPRVRPVTDQAYVTDHGLITCPGGTAALDLAAAIVARHCGRARALKGVMSMLGDPHQAAHRFPHRPYESLTVCGDWRVEQAVLLMERHLSQPFGIEELARRLGSSVRELNRAFARHAAESPAAIWRKMRLAHGHWLLINTSRNITQVAHETGFADTAHFSRWFKRVFGEAPKSFRRRRALFR